LIDSPGMRELQLWVEEEGLDRAFEDIERLAAELQVAFQPRGVEPAVPHRGPHGAAGFALMAAIDEPAARREVRFTELKKDEKARRQQEKAAGKRFAARLKEVLRNKPRYR